MEFHCENVPFCMIQAVKVLFLLCFLPTSFNVKASRNWPETHLLVLQHQSVHDNNLDSADSERFPRRERRDVDGQVENPVEVHQFHVSSKLFSHFATVTMTSEVMNTAEQMSTEIAFRVQVPEVAFMSSFTMVVNGKTYIAEVLEREAAERRYQEARERNQTAGQVKRDSIQPERGMEIFVINVNLAPRGNATFTLIYNELLERREGVYRQVLVIQPGSVVANMTVRAAFAEHQGFKYFAYKLPGNEAELTASSQLNETSMMAKPDSREVVFKPTVKMQRNFDPQRGIHGKFTILYSVNDDPSGGRIIVQNDYFAHFFAPPGLTPLPKNILFIVDISGSMSGDKILKAKDAMLKILDDLRSHASDTFNILPFDDRFESWTDVPESTLPTNIDNAMDFVRQKLKSRGGTDIHQALMKGLDLLLTGRKKKSCSIADIIIFLTDGDPTSGITDIGKIIDDVTARNKGWASIFSLAFGFGLNFDFLSTLSDLNRGFARRIYAEGDANDQLRNFYGEISTPVLCDVDAQYNSEAVDPADLTFTSFPLFFDGREIVVAGKTKTAADISTIGAELHGTGAQGPMDFIVPVEKVVILNSPDIEGDLTEKLWAYMKIKSLLKQAEVMESLTEKNKTRQQALNMSLEYGFVTPLTSFSIVVNDENNLAMEEDSMKAGGHGSGNYFSPAGVSSPMTSPWGVILVLSVLLEGLSRLPW